VCPPSPPQQFKISLFESEHNGYFEGRKKSDLKKERRLTPDSEVVY